jgi:hypothetical protein
MSKIDAAQMDKLKAMNRKIEDAEKAIRELKELGGGVPVIEKNARSLLSITYALKFGISDLLEIE